MMSIGAGKGSAYRLTLKGAQWAENLAAELAKQVA
ncbi:MAG: hypothetical protein FD180_4535 [Planctomycetota bacterium]|nr:MAG: hypothetical protein FD180_4535 [Planctomycetota bacterium]